jgi:lysophospholipase L1-like esterase
VFDRYVAFGNSVTSGFQSAGINDSTQQQSYAALVAARLGVPFDAPLLTRPGCPPPLVDVFSGATVGGTSAPICSFLETATHDHLTNVAVPGAKLVDIFSNTAPGNGANPLTAIMLGGRTQLQAARATAPTFITVWIGHNEILDAAENGDPSQATDPATFATRYTAVVDSLATLGVQGALLLAVLDPTKIPFLSTGAGYWQASHSGTLPAGFMVTANCAPGLEGGVGDETLVPFSYGIGELLRRASGGQPVTLDCVNDARLLSSAETTTLRSDLASYNATISARAAVHGWIYLDLNPVFDSLRATGEIPAFPNLPPDPLSTMQPFGRWLSRDGVHPSALAHQLVANRIVAAINTRYGTAFGAVP